MFCLSVRLPAKLEELEAERRSGSSARRPPRFPARLKAESRSQTVGQLSAVRPQFQSQPLVGERFNRFYSRNRARNSTPSPSFSFNILVQH